jgi:hypothetical protein
MIKVAITDIEETTISGVTVVTAKDLEPYRENHFVWTATPLEAPFKSASVSGGFLKMWHHTPVFTEVETHVDAESFFFTSGTALMIFADVKGGAVRTDTIQIVRIRPYTQFVIAAGKAHFVAVAEGDEPVMAVVVSPKMDAPRIALPEPVEGI